MSRCYSCQKILTPQELSTKFSVSGEYTEMCYRCLATIDASYDEPELSADAEEEENDT